MSKFVVRRVDGPREDHCHLTDHPTAIAIDANPSVHGRLAMSRSRKPASDPPLREKGELPGIAARNFAFWAKISRDTGAKPRKASATGHKAASPEGLLVMLHILRATKQTVHWGYFDASLAPALRVKSGDHVHVQAITHHAGDAPDLMMDNSIRQLYRDIPEDDRNPGVHILTGPIEVEGAKPGDMLEVRYLSMIPRFRYGSNLAANWGYLYKEFGEKERVTIYQLDESSNQAEALFGYDYPGKYLVPGKITHPKDCNCQPALPGFRIPVRPHLGTAGVAPNAKGRVSSIPPGLHGGNIDNWRIGAGSVVFYPVQIDGGMFSVGDPHISQGDGELSGTAIEASLDVMLQIAIRRDFHFPSPLIETPNEWMVHGFHEDLNVAMRSASLEMLRLLTELKGTSRDDAYSLMSVAADFTVTQVVDGRQGIHARIPRSVFPPKK